MTMHAIRVRRFSLLTLILWALVLLAAGRLLLLSASVATRPSDGFAAYYTAARLVRADHDIELFYDDGWFRAQVAMLVPGVQDIYNVNPPSTALLLLPVSEFSYPTARRIWTALNVMFLAITLVLLVAHSSMRGFWIPAFVLVALLSQPLTANVRQGQAYVFLLMLMTLAWAGWHDHRAALLGIPLGLALILKMSGVLLPLLLLVRRCWAGLGWCAATAVGVGLVTLAWAGVDAWLRFLRLLTHVGDQPERAVTAYQSLPSLLAHLFVYDAQWNPDPLISAPALERVLSASASVVLLGVTIYVAWRARASNDLLFAAFVVASIVLSPVSLDYHYTLLLLPFGILTARVSRERQRWPVATLVLAAGCIAADLPYRSPALASGATAILAYPKLYGALLLWGTSIWLAYKDGTTGVSSTSPLEIDKDRTDPSALVPTTSSVGDSNSTFRVCFVAYSDRKAVTP